MQPLDFLVHPTGKHDLRNLATSLVSCFELKIPGIFQAGELLPANLQESGIQDQDMFAGGVTLCGPHMQYSNSHWNTA